MSLVLGTPPREDIGRDLAIELKRKVCISETLTLCGAESSVVIFSHPERWWDVSFSAPFESVVFPGILKDLES